MLKQLGATDETIAELERWPESDTFDAREKAALALADQMTKDARRVSDAQWETLKAHFDEDEVIELSTVIGLFNYFNRLSDALQVDITR